MPERAALPRVAALATELPATQRPEGRRFEGTWT